MSRSEVPFAEVLNAITELAVTGWGDGVLASDHQLFTELRERLHVDFAMSGSAGRLGYQSQQAASRFSSQVSRALNKLAEPGGPLRKAGADSTGPDGRRVDRTQVRYYTPAAWRAAQLAHEQEVIADQAVLHRSDSLCGRLQVLGIAVTQRADGALRMDLDAIEALVIQAEAWQKWLDVKSPA